MKKAKLTPALEIALSVAALLLICALFLFSFHINHYDPAQVSKITIWNGLTGSEFEITDEDAVSEVIEQLNDLSPSVGIRTRPTGCHYLVRLYDTAGNTIASIELADDSLMFIDRCTYWVQTSDIIEYLHQLEHHA